MMAKIEVNGPNEHPLYTWLKANTNQQMIHWNFTNFLVDRCGRVRYRHEPAEVPEQWEDEVKELLNDHSPC